MIKRQASPKRTPAQERYALSEWCERHGNPDPKFYLVDAREAARIEYARAVRDIASSDPELREARARRASAWVALTNARTAEKALNRSLSDTRYDCVAWQDQAEFDWARSIRSLGEAELRWRLADADVYDAWVRARQRARERIDPRLLANFERETALRARRREHWRKVWLPRMRKVLEKS